jgi:cytochrome o ubiquinol oxidase subunit 1
MPLYLLGLMGMTRRMQHYDNLAWQPWLLVAMVGAVVILGGIACQIVQLVVSIRARDKLRVSADPWNGRTLEWATASPPPAWNFAFEPNVSGIDAFWIGKRREQARQDKSRPVRAYEPIEMPKNNATGFVSAFFAVVIGFAMIWHIWWMASLGLLGAFVTLLVFGFRRHTELEVPAEQIAQFERAQQAGAAA